MKEKAINFLKFMKEVEKLKSVTRHSWTSSKRHESVAEHSWRMAFMAMVLGSEFPKINISRVIEMTIIHDLGEVYEGDYPAFKDQPENKFEIEEKAVKRVIRDLPLEIQNKIMGLWTEYEECKTQEAKLAKALDKLETLIQHNESDPSTLLPLEYEFNLKYGKKFMEFDEFIKELREVVDEQTKEKFSNLDKFIKSE